MFKNSIKLWRQSAKIQNSTYVTYICWGKDLLHPVRLVISFLRRFDQPSLNKTQLASTALRRAFSAVATVAARRKRSFAYFSPSPRRNFATWTLLHQLAFPRQMMIRVFQSLCLRSSKTENSFPFGYFGMWKEGRFFKLRSIWSNNSDRCFPETFRFFGTRG